MKSVKKRICLCCKEPFEADARNAHHQKYCTLPTCRKASKTASQSIWIARPENVNYHSGACAVTWVRDWQKAHPDYRTQQNAQKAKRRIALQDFINLQVTDLTIESPILPEEDKISILPDPSALQDFINTQPYVFM